MALLSASALRAHIETDLSDVALDRLAAAAERMIAEVAGDSSSQTETFSARPNEANSTRLYMTRRVSAIDSVEERDRIDGTVDVLSANDYELQRGRILFRRGDGDNPRTRWADIVEVTYTPDTDTELRERVQIDLVKLGIDFSAFSREEHGDFESEIAAPRDRVNAALAPLMTTANRPLVV